MPLVEVVEVVEVHVVEVVHIGWADMTYLPEDIRPQWLNVIRRVQSVAKSGHDGNAVITISVVVDPDGYPVSWTEPQRMPLEPKRMAQETLEALGVNSKRKE